jgi:hypothetical protein
MEVRVGQPGCNTYRVPVTTLEAAPVERSEAVHSSRIDPSDPAALLAAQAQLVNQALDVAEHAGDHRTQLAAIPEARDGLTVIMRTAGMLQSDGSVVIDSRRQTLIANMAALSVETSANSRRFIAFAAIFTPAYSGIFRLGALFVRKIYRSDRKTFILEAPDKTLDPFVLGPLNRAAFFFAVPFVNAATETV